MQHEKKIHFELSVIDGKLVGLDKERFSYEIREFEGKKVLLTIEAKSLPRSYKQNRLYWVYVDIMAKDLGYDSEEMHEIIKFKFLKKTKVDIETGEEFEYIGKTSKLSKEEFKEFIDKLIIWAADYFHIILPAPFSNE